MRKPLAGIAIAAIALASTAPADVIVLKDGSRLEGRVETVPGRTDRVLFLTGNAQVEYPRARIKELIEEPDAVDYRRIGLKMLETNSFSEAAEYFRKSLAADPDDEEAKAGLERASAELGRIAEESQRASSATIDALIDDARAAIKAGDFPRAEDLLRRAQEAGPSETQRLAAQLVLIDLHTAWGFQRWDRMDPKGAEKHYSRVLELDPDNANAQERLLQVWANDPSKREEVLKAYQLKLRKDPDNLELNAKVADLLIALQRFEEAVAPLEKLHASPRYQQIGYSRQLETTLKDLSRKYSDQNNYDQAIRYFERLMAAFPGTDGSELAVLRYRRAVSQLDPADYTGRARLIGELDRAGLTDYAADEAELIRTFIPEDPIIRRILQKQAETALADIADALQRGDYLVVQDSASRFVNRFARYPDLVQKAQEMNQRATVEAERQAKSRKDKAREIADRGIEYYQQALAFSNQLRSTEVRSGSRPYSAKQEAIKFARRAIDHLETAIRTDPSLAPISGMDLNSRLADAKRLYSNLTQSGTPLDRYRYVPNSERLN
jgi:tetratricopeptide (TPR) repeat protein